MQKLKQRAVGVESGAPLEAMDEAESSIGLRSQGDEALLSRVREDLRRHPCALVLRPGARLYHGTSEDLEGPMQPGGYDGVFWTTDSRTIARTYIPVAGMQSSATIRGLAEAPTDKSGTADLQAQLGIEFKNLSYHDPQGNWHLNAQSYRQPELFDALMADTPRPVETDFANSDAYYRAYFGWKELQKTRVWDHIRGKLADLGYAPDADRGQISYDGGFYWLKVKHGEDGKERILPNRHQEGTLLEFTPKRDLVIYDLTGGGSIEGDLTDVDYHRLKDFREIEALGFDGVKINDFAQVEGWGNVGHDSLGFFAGSIPMLQEVSREVTTHPDDYRADIDAERETEAKRFEVDGQVVKVWDRVPEALVSRFVQGIHRDEEDFVDGDLQARLERFSTYELRDLPIGKINLEEWAVDDALVKDFSERDTQAPPIVWDPERHSMIDGIHRANAAKRRGEARVLAFVGVKN